MLWNSLCVCVCFLTFTEKAFSFQIWLNDFSLSHSLPPSTEHDSVCLELDSLSQSRGDDLEAGVQFSIWVSFYEIYNEFLYDLLDASPSMQPRKRATLRLSDDKQGNPYVKGNADSFTEITHTYMI